MSDWSELEAILTRRDVGAFRARAPAADRWARGVGAIEHSPDTQARVFALAQRLGPGPAGDGVPFFELLEAADRLTNAAMWLVVHETYARNVYLDGRPLEVADFKRTPEGHTGGSLNMVPAYVGYLVANALTGTTRGWIMGQGHCVAAVDSANLLVGNVTAGHGTRYSVDDPGLTRYVRDFYSLRLGEDDHQDSPLGSHVNGYTAGGVAEGGYLGFTELQYVHMPLPGEHLVAFLSDGAFEEQRGSDWIPRWWRAEDTGVVTPIMIKNGRRIDQRTTLAQSGDGLGWFVRHLELNGFAPLVFDGRDPAAFAWAILTMEDRLTAAAEAVGSGSARYPVPLPYGVAVAPKGAGFYGEGENLAHNLPLGANPRVDAVAAERFNESARRLWVPEAELRPALEAFGGHHRAGRPRERDHPVAHRRVTPPVEPPLALVDVPVDRRDPDSWTRMSPMAAVDRTFADLVAANPQLRPRVGNPDEMRSNRMLATLDLLRFRVTDPEPGIPEDICGAVITALNEEAVASAALANKAGINIVVTYEAFGMKMHGVMRQEVIFAGHASRAGRPQEWLSVPVVLTSHTWENAKNEQSHQDPALAEVMWGEWSDVSRVVFPVDHTTAALTTRAVYRTHGQIWTVVVPKSDSVPVLFTADEAADLVERGAIELPWAGHARASADVVLTAIGGFQTEEVLRASARLAQRDVPHTVVVMLEPGRFRQPRTDGEAAHCVPAEHVAVLYPPDRARVFVTHTRPEPLLGLLAPLHSGWERTTALGFLNRGGTLGIPELLFVNRSTWAHTVAAAADVTGRPRDSLLSDAELAALSGQRSPEGVIIPVRAPA
jgi:phosphoketolase